MPGIVNDLRGQRFGRLTVPEGAAPVIHHHNAYWPVIYDCGQVGLVAGFHLCRGETVSCGCWRADPAVRRAAKLQPAARRRAIAELAGQPPGVACAAYYQQRGTAKVKSGDPAGAHRDFGKSQAILFTLSRQADRFRGPMGSQAQTDGAAAGARETAGSSTRVKLPRAPGKTPERQGARLQGSAKRRRQAAASRKTGTAPEPQRPPDKTAEIQAEKAPASANRGGPDFDAGRYQRLIAEFEEILASTSAPSKTSTGPSNCSRMSSTSTTSAVSPNSGRATRPVPKETFKEPRT